MPSPKKPKTMKISPREYKNLILASLRLFAKIPLSPSTMATLYSLSLLTPKSLLSPRPQLTCGLQPFSVSLNFRTHFSTRSVLTVKAGRTDSDYSSKRSSSNEPRETIMLPGCDYNHWLIVMEFPKDPAPTREQMIETYLNTLATVLGR